MPETNSTTSYFMSAHYNFLKFSEKKIFPSAKRCAELWQLNSHNLWPIYFWSFSIFGIHSDLWLNYEQLLFLPNGLDTKFEAGRQFWKFFIFDFVQILYLEIENLLTWWYSAPSIVVLSTTLFYMLLSKFSNFWQVFLVICISFETFLKFVNLKCLL